MRRSNHFIALGAFLLLGSFPLRAADIELAGLFGDRAVLIVDGGRPQTLKLGQRSKEGVRLVGIQQRAVLLDVEGESRRVPMGSAPVRIAEQHASPQSSSVRLTPDLHGHYWVQGAIEGVSTRFMLDTGSTLVAINTDLARRAGINYRAGRPVRIITANGEVRGYLVTLDRISVGGIVLSGVEATVHESGLDVALLGMSFIRRLDLYRESGILVLRKRF